VVLASVGMHAANREAAKAFASICSSKWPRTVSSDTNPDGATTLTSSPQDMRLKRMCRSTGAAAARAAANSAEGAGVAVAVAAAEAERFSSAAFPC
jgi:hypothetical protein